MTPADAGRLQLEEPDWTLRYYELTEQENKTLPIELREDAAFHFLLREYRIFHHTGVAPNRKPMDYTQAAIALAQLRLFPPRSRTKNILRDGKLHEPQFDEHVWITNERAWRIVAIEAGTLFLDSFGDKKQVDMSRVNWPKYVEARLASLS